MATLKEIIELIEQFDRNIERYKSGDYKEEDVRAELIDKFFKALEKRKNQNRERKGWQLRSKFYECGHR